MKYVPAQIPHSVPPLPKGDEDENPRGIDFLALLAEDLATYEYDLTTPGLWAVLLHRLGNRRMRVQSRVLRAPCTLAYRVAKTCVHLGFGIKLDYTVKLGRRVRIWHHGGMVLGARSIGDDVHIRQNTTFGIARRSQPNGKPIIEDRVDIGCGAVLLGHIRVGHDSMIGANTVVTTDVPAYSTVVGEKARIRNRNEVDQHELLVPSAPKMAS